LTDLNEGTHVIFEGETTFGYKEWSGPLVSVSGTGITVTGASGSVLNGLGPDYWDGKGSNGGKTKPKFFYAHRMTSSTITGISILNSPVQVFSIDSSTNLNLIDITINDSEGTSNGLGANTDGFDIGESTNIYISGANVQIKTIVSLSTQVQISPSLEELALVVMVFLLDPLVAVAIIPSRRFSLRTQRSQALRMGAALRSSTVPLGQSAVLRTRTSHSLEFQTTVLLSVRTTRMVHPPALQPMEFQSLILFWTV